MAQQIDPQILARRLAALRGLSSRQRAIFFAVVDFEASYAALADRFNMTVTEVEGEFARALDALDAAADG